MASDSTNKKLHEFTEKVYSKIHDKNKAYKHYEFNKEELNKFVELIISECLSIVRKNSVTSTPFHNKFDQQDYETYKKIQDICAQIEAHFNINKPF